MQTLEEYLEVFKPYKNLCNIITAYWKDDEILALWMNYMLQDTRENTRQGFPQQVVDAMLMLYNQRRKQLEYYTHMGFVSDILHSDVLGVKK